MGDEPQIEEDSFTESEELQLKSRELEHQKPQQPMLTSVGPEDFIPIQLLGKGSFGEVYLVQMK